MPKISVVMTVFNTEKSYLKQAINSVLEQTFSDFEFIIVDDGSTVPVEKILEDIKDSRIKILRNEKNSGIIKSANKGLEAAVGEYIFRMDSDDIAHPDRFKKQVDFLDLNKNVNILGTAFEKFPKKKQVFPPTDNETIKYTLRFLYNPIANPTVAIRKSSLDKFNVKYNEENKICEDYGMWLEFIDDLTFANLPEVLLNYRWHGKNISKTKTKIQSAGAQKLMFKAQAKYFKKDATKALLALDKFVQNKFITSIELKDLSDFALSIKNSLNGGEYELNRAFYKAFLKSCTLDINYLKFLFSKELNSLIKLDLPFKISCILKI